MHLESGPPSHYCVTCVIASLESDSPLGIGCKLVYGLALTLVPPLGTEHDAGWHVTSNMAIGV